MFRKTAQGPRSLWIAGFASGLILAVASTSGSAAEKTSTPGSAPRPTMRLVFEEMTTLIPLGLDEARWSAPAERARVLAALERLDALAVVLEHHGRAREAGFDELALSLGRDLVAARDHYAAGQYSEARFFFTGSLQSCVSCHVRLPSDRDFDMAEALTKSVDVEALDPRERAWLHVMARRFDDALGIWEGLMEDPAVSPAQLDASGVLVDYLNVALRVRTDVERARRTLDQLAQREDLPVYLAERVKTWRGGLGELSATELTADLPPTVDRGERLAREGAHLAAGPYGRDGLIQDLAAASLLVRYLEDDRERTRRERRNRTDDERRAASRAYYWLATVEARSLDGFWVNLAERHFEAAIRSDPRGAWARRAYTQLEEMQILGFGGASSEVLPPDVWDQLRSLRELMGLEPAIAPPEEAKKSDR